MKNKAHNNNISGSSLNAFFDRLYKLLAVCGVTAAVTPLGAIFTNLYGMPELFRWLAPIAAVAVGYLLQALAAAVMRYKRRGSVSRNYERKSKYVYGIVMLPTAIAAGVISIFVFKGVFSYLRRIAETDRNFLFDASSLTPYLLMLSALIFMLLGAFLWFMPFDRLVSYRSIWGLLTLQFISFVFSGLRTAAGSVGAAVCLAVYIVCVMVIVNQSYILRTFDNNSDNVITPSARMYNMALVLVILLCVLVVGAGVGVIVTGLSVLGRLLLYTAIGSFISSEVDSDTLVENFDAAVFGNASAVASTGINKILFAIFIVIMVAVALIMIFGHGWGLLKRLADLLTAIFNRIVEFLLDPMRGMSDTRLDDYESYNNRVVVTERYYNENRSPHRRDLTYHDFTRALSACCDDGERVRLAYTTLVRHWRTMDYGIRTSDTPDEICAKLRAKTGIENAADITELFDQIKYGSDGTIAVKDGILDKMCALIKKYRS